MKRRLGARLLSMLMAVMLVMGFAPDKVKAADKVCQPTPESSFVCGLDGVITAYNGDRNISEIAVPLTVGGVTVTGIGDNVFLDCANLATVVMPASVTSIGAGAFAGCKSLSCMCVYAAYEADGSGIRILEKEALGVITLPDSLASLGVGVFAGCTSINRFAIADANAAFKTGTAVADSSNQNQQTPAASGEPVPVARNYGELLMSKDGTKLYRLAPAFHYTGQGLYPIPLGVVSIEPYALEKVSLNGGFTVPTTTTSIGDYAFYQCGNLNTVEFAETSIVTSIGQYAFAYNSNLNITLPASVTSIDKYSFAYCSNIQADISKTQITAIPECAFYEDDNLHELTAPATLRSIEAYAFSGCDNLNTVKFSGETLDKLGTGVFKTCPNLHEIVIPEGVTSIENDTFDGCFNLNKVVLPDSLERIGDNAFKDCRNIHEMVIPKNVKYISNTSFSGAKQDEIDTSNNAYSQKFIKGKLPLAGEKFTVGSYKYKVIKSDAKKGTVAITGAVKKSLKSVAAASTVKYNGYEFKVVQIGDNAFKGMKKLKKVTIGANVTKIGKNAFKGDKKLKTIKVKSKKIKKVGKAAFKGIAKKAKFSVPKAKKAKYKKLFKKGGITKSMLK